MDDADAVEAARMRAALAPDAQDAPAATWRDIEARAAAGAATVTGPPSADLPKNAGQTPPDEATNEARPWRQFGWAAALVLGVGLITLMAPPAPTPAPDAALRGIAGPGAQAAQWLVERPLESAEALAADLRSLQAEVTVTREGDAAILSIRARPGAVDAVNARLVSLETGLDAEGKLQLAVRPMR
ncbi:MAG: hypothetical protein IPM99_00340 [Rubrivivax sp.]|nr:hypothetical protein [Rubrivivax sp.]